MGKAQICSFVKHIHESVFFFWSMSHQHFFSEPYAMWTLCEYCQKANIIPPTNTAELRWRCYSMLGPATSRFKARAIQYGILRNCQAVLVSTRFLLKRDDSSFLKAEVLIWIRWSINTVAQSCLATTEKQLCSGLLWRSFQCDSTMIPSHCLKMGWHNDIRRAQVSY